MCGKELKRCDSKLAGGRGWLSGLVVLLVVMTACSTSYYKKSADKEVYGIIENKENLVPNMESDFTIKTNELVNLNALPTVTDTNEALGQIGAEEVGSKIVNLNTALEIAVKNSRTYQNEKESLYSQALSLTLARHEYSPIFSGSMNADYQSSVSEVNNIIERDHSISGGGGVGMDWFLRTGARLATDFSTDFFRYLIGDSSLPTSSRLAGTLTQPLLRGAGYKVAMENLTQAERNMLYALRNFVQFRREFIVQTTSTYYGVLQDRENVRNALKRYESFTRQAARTRSLATEGRTTQTELGRLEQEEISAEISLNNAMRNYKRSLDQFKIQLGLPMDTNIILDDNELDNLEIIHPEIDPEQAVHVAMVSRLDLFTVRDQYEDAARKLDLAENGLLPDLDLVLQASVDSEPGTGLPELEFSKVNWGAGLNLNLPFDRKSERNSYRSAMIRLDQAARELELSIDNMKFDVYEDLRRLQQARSNYESSKLGVQISERRVEEQDLLAELGRATAQDQVDAQNDLTSSQNALVAALVDHNIARLQLWRDLGILTIKDNGQWEEITNLSGVENDGNAKLEKENS